MSKLINELTPGQKKQQVLVIQSLGGSGEQVVRACKALIKDLGSVPVRFSVLDIDPQYAAEYGSDFYWLGDVPIHDFIAEVEARPQDFPGYQQLGSLERLKKAAGATQRLRDGGQMEPLLSKAALLWQLCKRPDLFKQHLKRPVQDLITISPANGQDSGQSGASFVHPATQQMPPVVITQVAGASGSVGSGTALMVADLHHQNFREEGLKNGQVDQAVVLPSCLDASDDRLGANTWAWLQAVMPRYESPAQPDYQLGKVAVKRSTPPWAWISLWGRITTAGWSYKDLTAVSQVMAEVWRMQYVGPTAESYHARLVDLAGYQYPNIATAHGAHRLTLEVEDLITLAGHQAGQELIQFLLRSPSSGPD